MKKTEIIEQIQALNELTNLDDNDSSLLCGRSKEDGGECVCVDEEDDLEDIITKFIDAVEWIDGQGLSDLLTDEIVDFYESAPWKEEFVEEDQKECSCGGDCGGEGTCSIKETKIEQPKEIQIHEAANIFPMERETLEDLAEDIKTNGQKVPIGLYEGKILDGRRRWSACLLAKVEPTTIDLDDKVEDPVAYVISLNLHRRHLTPSQRAMAASRARDYYDTSAKSRQSSAGGDKRSKASQGKTASGKISTSDPGGKKSRSRDAAGKAVGVSGKMVDYGTKVTKKGSKELVKAVDEGKIKVKTAAALVDEPEAKQKEVLKKVSKGEKVVVKGQKVVVSSEKKKEDNTTEKFVVDVVLKMTSEWVKIPETNKFKLSGIKMLQEFIDKEHIAIRSKAPVKAKKQVSTNKNKKSKGK